MPDFSFEQSYDGPVCGIDEVGRGPLAGPVVTACVYIPEEIYKHDFIKQIQDSKMLSKTKLLNLYDQISQHCIYGLGQCSPEEIDELNILWATMRAMERAYTECVDRFADKHGDSFVCALIDGNRVPNNLPCQAEAIKKGDAKSISIAAASILAKVTRDKFMAKLAEDYPHYGWERNAAYPSKEHLAALETHGVTPHHRKSFGPVKRLLSA